MWSWWVEVEIFNRKTSLRQTCCFEQRFKALRRRLGLKKEVWITLKESLRRWLKNKEDQRYLVLVKTSLSLLLLYVSFHLQQHDYEWRNKLDVMTSLTDNVIVVTFDLFIERSDARKTLISDNIPFDATISNSRIKWNMKDFCSCCCRIANKIVESLKGDMLQIKL